MRTIRKYKTSADGKPLSPFLMMRLNQMIDVVQRLDQKNDIPGSSSNFSIRDHQNSEQILITKSGYHKRDTTPSHFMWVDLQGNALSTRIPKLKPSDETLLHTLIYKWFPNINAVIHCHPKLTQSIKPPGHTFSGGEMLKILGKSTHQSQYYLPCFANDQDMDRLAKFISEKWLSQINATNLQFCAFVLERHGIYVGGRDPIDCELRLEGICHEAAVELR